MMKESENIFSISQKRAQILHSLWKRSVQNLVSLTHVAFKIFCTISIKKIFIDEIKITYKQYLIIPIKQLFLQPPI
jgi:hypothetical protein